MNLDFSKIKRVAVSGFTDPVFEMQLQKKGLIIKRFAENIPDCQLLIMADPKYYCRKKKIAEKYKIPIVSKEEAVGGFNILLE
jgi:hypothetical protein